MRADLSNASRGRVRTDLLQAHDIPALVMVDDSGGAEPVPVQLVGGGAHVMVRADDVAEARQVLDPPPRHPR